MAEFNPVLVKELRGRMRGARAFVLLTIYLLVLSGITLLFYSVIGDVSSSDLNAGQQIGKGLFLLITVVALIQVCLITPTLTAGSITGEKERQTYDLLISSLLSPWQIVWGKLGAALSFAALMILVVLPLMSLAFLFGGVSGAEVVIALIGMFATAIFYAAIGLFWSAVLRSSLGATSMALGSIIAMLLGIPFVALMFTLLTGFGSGPKWASSPLFVYAAGAILYSHPFIALQATEQQISNGDTSLFVNGSTSDFAFLPSPWIAYVLLALFWSAILIMFSLRMLRPGQGLPTRGKPRARQAATPAE